MIQMERHNMGLLTSPIGYDLAPDLSHLTEDERKIIQNVMARHRLEEETEAQILKQTQEEVINLEAAIRQKADDQRRQGIGLDATCQICLKTKFADGIGHVCNYCMVRCCARCGGKVSLRSNKAIWVCILCRKKQELMIKTGQWMQSPMASRLRQMEQDPSCTSPSFYYCHPLPSGPTGSALSSSYTGEGGHPSSCSTSYQENRMVFGPSTVAAVGTNTNTGSSSYSGVGDSFQPSTLFQANLISARRGSLGALLPSKPPGMGIMRRQWSHDTSLPPTMMFDSGTSSTWNEPMRKLPDCVRSIDTRSPSPHLLSTSPNHIQAAYEASHHDVTCIDPSSRSYSPRSRPRLPTDDLTTLTTVESGIGSDTATSHQRLTHQGSSDIPRLGNVGWSSLESGTGTAIGSGFESCGSGLGMNSHPFRRLPHQSSSFGGPSHRAQPTLVSRISLPNDPMGIARTQSPILGSSSGLMPGQPCTYQSLMSQPSFEGASSSLNPMQGMGSSLDYASMRRGLFQNRAATLYHNYESPVSRCGSRALNNPLVSSNPYLRTDSLSSEQSEPEVPKNHRLRMRRERTFLHQHQYFSMSSSDEELRGGTPADDFVYRPLVDQSNPGVRKFPRSCMKREDILDAKIKRFLAHPITWKPSSDGSKLIGHMILSKSLAGDEPVTTGSSATVLGLKIVGGRITPGGSVGALIEKVKKGSIADTVGKLRPLDEVLEWNGRSLQGLTFEEVYDIMAESRQESQVEMIVCRHMRKLPLTSPVPINPSAAIAAAAEANMHSLSRLSNHPDLDCDVFEEGPKVLSRRHTDVDINVSNLKSDASMWRQQSLGAQLPRSRVRVSRSSTISGRIQVKLWYDIQSLQLVVTILGAVELPPRSSGQPRTPFAKICLLPDRSEKSKRRTKIIPGTNDPKWNQTFVYAPLRRSDLKNRAFEIALWDYDRFGCSEFLGEVLIELATAPLDDEPEWYLLGTHEETIAQLRMQQKLHLLPPDRLSPPSTISRLSDSEMSDIEYYESDFGINTSRESWRGLLADTSQSSFESCGSPHLGLRVGGGVTVTGPVDAIDTTIPVNPYAYRRAALQAKIREHHHRQQRLETGGHPLYGDSMMTTSLPVTYDGDYPHDMNRPCFRKSASQPTRPMSPAMSLRSPTEYRPPSAALRLGNIPPQHPIHRPHSRHLLHHQPLSTGSIPHHLQHQPLSWSSAQGAFRQRQLPSVPSSLGRASRENMTGSPYETGRPMSRNQPPPLHASPPGPHVYSSRQYYRDIPSEDPLSAALNMSGIYSDSEVTAHSSDRMFYAHTTRPHSAAHHHPSATSARRSHFQQSASQSRPMYSPTERGLTGGASSGDRGSGTITAGGETVIEGESGEGGVGHERSPSNPPLYSIRKSRDDVRRESVEYMERKSRVKMPGEPESILHHGPGHRDRSISSHYHEEERMLTRRESSHAHFEDQSPGRLTERRYSRRPSEHHAHSEEEEIDADAAGHHRDSRSGSIARAPPRSSIGSDRTAIRPAIKGQRSLDDAGSIDRTGRILSQERMDTGSMSDTGIGGKTDSQEKLEELGSEAGGSASGREGSQDGKGKGPKGKADLNKLKSSSTSQLSVQGTKKRLGFRKKNATSFSVHRSEEVAPDEVRHLVKQASSASSEGEGSISGESAATWVPAMRLQTEGDMSVFVEGLGPGQLVGRQALASVNFGDIQLSICQKNSCVEIEVVRARNLMAKPGSRNLPATYVKVYMWKNRKCVAKARTSLARRTLDPLYQQQLLFHEDSREAVLQICVYGDYGKLDKKSFMGMAQVCLDDLDLTNIVIGWYKLLPPTTATLTNLAPSTALQEANEAKMAAMAAKMPFFNE